MDVANVGKGVLLSPDSISLVTSSIRTSYMYVYVCMHMYLRALTCGLRVGQLLYVYTR